MSETGRRCIELEVKTVGITTKGLKIKGEAKKSRRVMSNDKCVEIIEEVQSVFQRVIPRASTDTQPGGKTRGMTRQHYMT